MNGDHRVLEALQFPPPPGRTHRLGEVNTLWAELLSEPSTAIADLIHVVDRALALACPNRTPTGTYGATPWTNPEIGTTSRTTPRLSERP
jgi:hypothetical protein